MLGRPEEYKPEYIIEVEKYLLLKKDEFENKKLKVNLPTIEGFAVFIDVSKKSLYNWEDQHPEFIHSLDKIRTEQKERLINYGLSGDYNSTIAKLVLSANHGMREGTDITTQGERLPTPILANALPNNNSNEKDNSAKKEDSSDSRRNGSE